MYFKYVCGLALLLFSHNFILTHPNMGDFYYVLFVNKNENEALKMLLNDLSLFKAIEKDLNSPAPNITAVSIYQHALQIKLNSIKHSQ